MFQFKPIVIIVFFLVVFGLRVAVNFLFNPDIYKTRYYSVNIPENWEKKEYENKVVFKSKERHPLTNLPVATFAIYSVKTEDAIFLEDYFPKILAQLKASRNGDIIDHGQILVDGEVSSWVLFHDLTSDVLTLTFHIADKFNRLTKLEYEAQRDKFQEYRPKFEEFKENFKFKKLF